VTAYPDSLNDSLATLDEACREGRAREAAYRAWLDEALPAMADELTGLLPPEMRAAGIRFEWAEQG
jgi:hypothetical protein